MKTGILLSSLLLVTACATTSPKSTSTQSTAPATTNDTTAIVDADNAMDFSVGDNTLKTDSYSQALYSVLSAIRAPDIVRYAMTTKMEEEQTDINPEFVSCLDKNMTDNILLNLFLPIYKTYINPTQAEQLADFFESDAGQKFATVVRIQTGADLPLPKIEAEDVQQIQQAKPLLSLMQDPGIKQKAETAGFNLGVRLALECGPIN